MSAMKFFLDKAEDFHSLTLLENEVFDGYFLSIKSTL